MPGNDARSGAAAKGGWLTDYSAAVAVGRVFRLLQRLCRRTCGSLIWVKKHLLSAPVIHA